MGAGLIPASKRGGNKNVLYRIHYMLYHCGAFFAMMWYVNYQGKKGALALAILMACAIGLTITRIMFWDAENQYKKWNDGICAQCGGQMEFTGASRARADTYYYFQCEDCGKIIELTYNPY